MEVSVVAPVRGVAQRAARADRGLRTIHVGVLGLGNVGQAVLRTAAAAAGPLRQRGLALSIECALVRDVTKPRRCPRASRITSNIEAFMRGRYDVVIDALAGCEPAAAVTGRLLGRGVPVVSANKAMIAEAGPRLRRVAARTGAALRIEAAVMAGVPFLGGFERRPLAADATRVAGIVNGTSHFILSRVSDGLSFADALSEAQGLGYAEPDPDADVSGRDALDKLLVLADVLFGCTLEPRSVAREGIGAVTPAALAAATALGGVLKPVVCAARSGAGIDAFVGPAWVGAAHPLARVSGRDNAIVIDSRFSGRLFFAGPGAGPDVTAATLLDDAVEAVCGAAGVAAAVSASSVTSAGRPETGWFLHAASGSWEAWREFAALQIRTAGLAIQKQITAADHVSALLAPASAERVAAVAAALRAHGIEITAWRTLDE